MSQALAAKGSVTSLSIGQFTAAVVIEGAVVPLYEVEHSEDGVTATCWLESEAGKAFGVRWKDSERSISTGGRLSVDGIVCAGLVCDARRGQSQEARDSWAKLDYCTTSGTRRKLIFSKIQTTDDEVYANQTLSEEFGSIKLRIWQVDVVGRREMQSLRAWEKKTLEKVHERSKKAVNVHQVKFGEELPMSNVTKMIDAQPNQLLATFVFRYRPRDHLQANGIILPPTKKRKVDDIIDLTGGDGDDSDDSTGSRCDRKIRELEAQIQALKQKKSKRESKRIKTEVKQEVLL